MKLCCGKFVTILSLISIATSPLPAQDIGSAAPVASIDLTTSTGTMAIDGQWRYSNTRIVETGFRAPDADGQPAGQPIRTYDYEPHAGGADFDDSAWEKIAPDSLHQRRSTGKLCFNWYRIQITVPDRIDGFDTRGATIVFETSVDDYAEVWVDGEIPRSAGQSGGSVIKGWNANNRIVIARGARPGQKIQLAVFGINGPISSVPTNFIWMRTARLDFYRASSEPRAVPAHEVNVEIVRRHNDIDRVLPANTKLFKLAEGFRFGEGPVWVAGTLMFSDPNANRIYAYDAARQSLSLEDAASGYQGSDIMRYRQPGSNGLTLDSAGRLVVCEHGNRRVTRRDGNGGVTVLASHYNGRRLNSPNDLVFHSDGSLYFTDPPFGLPGTYDDPDKELPFSGVYHLGDGGLRLLTDELEGPNGIALSPDEKFLYVGNWDLENKVVMRYALERDGSLGRGSVFVNLTDAPGDEAIDGVKVNLAGDVFVSGPGGVWILASDGRHLGTIRGPRLPANFAWGGDDGRTLYLTAREAVYALQVLVPGRLHGPAGSR